MEGLLYIYIYGSNRQYYYYYYYYYYYFFLWEAVRTRSVRKAG